MCVFARHNLLQDPPFSRIDIISCRNVLIYFGLALQKRVMPIFHYALKPRAFLILGRSEGILGTASDLFELIDRKHKIYCRKSTPARLHFDFAASQHPLEAGNLATDKEASRKSEGGVRLFELNKEADRILLTKYAPVAVVINEDMESLQSRRRLGLYLELAPGRADVNIFNMAREGFLFDLPAAINKPTKQRIPVPQLNLNLVANARLKAAHS